MDFELIKKPEKMSIGKNVGPIRPMVASKFGVITAKNVPNPTAVFEASIKRINIVKKTDTSG